MSAFTYRVNDIGPLLPIEVEEALRSVCKPLADAAPGDILGTIHDFNHYSCSRPYPITEFITLDAVDGQPTPVRTTFGRLATETQADAALAAMRIQDRGFGREAL